MTPERRDELEKLTKSADVVLFMKGSKEMPQCGFSSQVVKILNHLETPFVTYDILANEELRTDMKAFSQWPTFPQLYVNGEFVGGCDIVTEMFSSGELEKLLGSS